MNTILIQDKRKAERSNSKKSRRVQSAFISTPKAYKIGRYEQIHKGKEDSRDKSTAIGSTTRRDFDSSKNIYRKVSYSRIILSRNISKTHKSAILNA